MIVQHRINYSLEGFSLFYPLIVLYISLNRCPETVFVRLIHRVARSPAYENFRVSLIEIYISSALFAHAFIEFDSLDKTADDILFME